MGRHTASYIAAQHRVSAGSTAPGAAMYVGRIGLLALALGIGAVVAGSTGIASAEGSADNNTAGPAAHSSDSSTGTRKVKAPSSVGPSGAKARKPGLSKRIPQKISTAPRTRSRLAATPTARSTPADSPTTNPAIANPVAAAVSDVVSAFKVTPSAGNTDGAPAVPMPMVQAVVQLVHREVERSALGANHLEPAIAPGAPSPTDQAPTVYGNIGKWMLEPNGQISDYGGLPYRGKTVLEPVNVIIVDPTSTSAAESARKLNTAMFWSGFPAQPIHSTGFRGTIDDVTYGQQPVGLLVGYSDNFFLFPNNHGRIFGPDPVETDTGYVWSGSFSTEEFVIYELLPRHAYVSSNLARNALAMRLIASGRATYGGMVPLNNSYNTATTTTGDHDGYAVVIVLK